MNKAYFAGTLLIKNNRILMVQELHTEAKGLWCLPLGHRESEESDEECALRETHEETGYRVTLGVSKEYNIDGMDFKSVHAFEGCEIHLKLFLATVDEGEMKKGIDMLDVNWFTYAETQQLPLRGDWVLEYVNDFLHSAQILLT